jgi:uncharacterized membrane protein
MWRDLWNDHRGTCIGVACGIFFGFVYLIAGFWDMLIFAFIVYIGYYVGKRVDRREPVFGLEELWRRLTERWKLFR